jgi:ADP-ribose pyrophosphatase
MARIVGEKRQALSRWVTLVERTVEDAAGTAQVFHSLSQADYVTVLALTPEGRIPLVRQFRPAVQRVSLELPGGLIDSAESAEAVAVRELQEEVGFAVSGKPILLGRLVPDTGRLENAFWCYFAKATALPDWRAESGVERVLFSRDELQNAILGGEFDHALHIALLGLAVLRGHLSWKS